MEPGLPEPVREQRRGLGGRRFRPHVLLLLDVCYHVEESGTCCAAEVREPRARARDRWRCRHVNRRGRGGAAPVEVERRRAACVPNAGCRRGSRPVGEICTPGVAHLCAAPQPGSRHRICGLLWALHASHVSCTLRARVLSPFCRGSGCEQKERRYWRYVDGVHQELCAHSHALYSAAWMGTCFFLHVFFSNLKGA